MQKKVKNYPKAIIFDFDRTLIYLYQDKSLLHKLAEEIRDLYIPYFEINNFENRDGYHVWHDAHRKMEKLYPSEIANSVNSLAEELVADFEMNVASSKNMLDGTVETIKGLGKKNIILGIVSSNNSEVIMATLKKYGIDKYFKGVYGRELPFCPDKIKPNPYPIVSAVNALGLSSIPVWYVGDDIVDIDASKSAGLYPVGIASGKYSTQDLKNRGAKLVFENIKQLYNYICGLNIGEVQ